MTLKNPEEYDIVGYLSNRVGTLHHATRKYFVDIGGNKWNRESTAGIPPLYSIVKKKKNSIVYHELDAIKKTRSETKKHILQYIKNKDWLLFPVLFDALEKEYHHGAAGISDGICSLKSQGLIETKETTEKYGKYGKGTGLIKEKKGKSKTKGKKKKPVKGKSPKIDEGKVDDFFLEWEKVIYNLKF